MRNRTYTEDDYLSVPENYDFILKKAFGYVPADISHKLLLMNTEKFNEYDTMFLDGEWDDEWEHLWDTKTKILQDFLDSQPPIIN